MSTLENRLVDLATVVGRDIKDLRASLNGIDTTTSERVRNTYQCEGPKELVYSCLGTSAEFHVVAQGNTYVPSTVEIAVSGSGHESVFVRQYTDGFTTLVRTATLLDEDGNTFFPGVVAAQGFVGDGSALTGLNAAALATGIVPLNRLPVGSGTNQVAFGEHSHGNVSSAGAIGTSAGKPIITGDQGVLTTGSFGTAAGTFCQGNDARLFDARTPKTHTHGSVTNDGCVGALSGLPLITGLGGQIQAGSFGTASGTFAQGNDPRFSDARAPLPHSHGVFDNDGTLPGFVHGSPLIVGPEGSVAQGAFSDEPGTFCQGNDPRLSNARTPLAHSHGQVTSDGRLGTSAGVPVITGTDGVLTTGAFGSAPGTFAQGNDPRFSDARTPLAHSHGPVTSDGHLGGTEGLPVITGPDGVLSTGVFGTGQGTFTEGNDPRLSDARTPLAHMQTWATITGTPNTLVGYGITDAVNLSHIGSSGTCHGVATQSTNGFMSATDKAKLDGVSLRAGKADFVHSGRNFPQGTFIRTSIPFNSTASVPWVLEIRGNSYGATYKLPFDIQIQGYILNDAIHNLGGYSNGASITGMIVGKYGYELCFWFPYQSYLQGFLVKCYDASEGHPENKVYAIENLPKPSQVIKYYDLDSVMAKSYHSKNIGEIMSNVDAYTLNGRTSSYFLNWANITGKPDPVIDIRGDATGSTTLQDLTSGTINLVNRNISAVDTRMVNEAPSTLPPALRADLKMASTINKVDGGLFNGVLSFRPYGTGSDWSAGGAYQLAFTPNRNVWLRYSGDNGVWQDWAQVNYTHPAKHAPSIITQDPQNRFVTDEEKAAWNAAKAYTDSDHPPTREEIEDALNGEVASHSHPVEQILGTLNGQITESQLYTTLSSRIDLVDGPDTLPGSVAARIASEAAARAQALVTEATDRATAIAAEAKARATAIAAEVGARENALVLEALTRSNAIAAEVTARTEALAAEASTRAAAINAEAVARADAISQEASNRAAALLSEAADRQAAITQEATVRQGADESLANEIDVLRATLSDEVSARTAAISTEQNARVAGDSAEASARETLAAQIRGNYTGNDVNQVLSGLLYSERTARVTDDQALSNRIDVLVAASSGDFQDLYAAVTAEETARVSSDLAIASDLSGLTARLDNLKDKNGTPTSKSLEASIVDNQQAQVSGDQALALSISSLASTVSDNFTTLNALVTTEASARTTADNAEVTARETLATQLRGTYAGSDLSQLTSGLLHSERVARTTADTAMASDITALQATVGANTAAITAEQTARASADSALTQQITTMQAVFANSKSVFTESFDDPQAATLWHNYAGAGEVSVVTYSDAVVGGKVLRIGDNSGTDQAWLVHKTLVPFNPNTLYRITARVRKVEGLGTLYIGWAGVAADKVTLVNTSGGNTSSSQHYHVASSYVAGPTWTTLVGYTKGFGTTTGTGGAGTLANPSKVHPSVRYLRPLILANYSGTPGITEIDSLTVDDITDARENAVAIAAEQTARATADTVEANSREALATQLRGAYTGTDITQLTSGLIYQEREARSTAISSEVTARESLAAQIRGSYPGGDILELSSGLLFQERTARVTGDSALAQDISLLRADVQLNTAAIIDEQEARADAVSAEASARETLSTQLRGAYTGTDVSELTSGLVFSERQARVLGDSTITSRIDALEATTTTAVQDLQGLVTAETTARTDADSALAQGLDTFQARLDNVKNELGNLTNKTIEATLVADRQARVDGDSALATEVNNLRTDVTTELATLSSAVTSEASARSAADSAESLSRNALATQLRGSYEGSSLAALTSGLLFDERQARSTADSAEVTARESLAAQLRGTYAGTDIAMLSSGLLYQESQARATQDSALATQITTLSTSLTDEITNRTAAVASEEAARISGDSAEATARGTLATQLRGSYTGTNVNSLTAGLLYNERVARVSADNALTSQITTLESTVNTNNSTLTTAQTTMASDISALSSNVTTLSTTVGGHTSSLQVLGESVDGLSAQYYVKTDVNGYVAGFGIANDGATSEFIVAADKFAIVTPGAPAGAVAKIPFAVGTVNGVSTVGINGALVVDGTINGMTLANGSITANKIAAGAITTSKLAANSVTGDHIAATSKITLDEGGKLTVGQNNVILDSTENKIIIAPDNGTIIGQEDLSGIDYCELAQGDMNFMYWNGASHQVYNSLKRVEMGMAIQNNVQVVIPGVWKQQPKIIVSPADIMTFNKNYATANQTLVCSAENITRSNLSYKFTPKAYLRLTEGLQNTPINLNPTIHNNTREGDIRWPEYTAWQTEYSPYLYTPHNTNSVTVSGTIEGSCYYVGWGGNQTALFYVKAYIEISGALYEIGTYSAKNTQLNTWAFSKTIEGLAMAAHPYRIRLDFQHGHIEYYVNIGYYYIMGAVNATNIVTRQGAFTSLADGTLNYMAIGE